VKSLEFVDGASLLGRPRYNLGARSLLLGPYDSPASHDAHFAVTFGSGDPILDSTDELRFSSTSGELLSYRLRVPENPTQGNFISVASELPIRNALPRLPLGTHFQMIVATHSQMDDDGNAIAIYRESPDRITRRVQIASNFEMLLGADQIRGFILHNPSDYLVSGWGPAPPPIGDLVLARALARFVNMLTPAFVELLDDGDTGACDRLKILLSETTKLSASPQRDTLIDSISRVQETFY
jgi:hypothetical protein